MASANAADDYVEPKSPTSAASSSSDITSIREKLKSKAYIPENGLPLDFLRIVLNQQQLNENNDSLLAQRLQYGMQHPVQMNQMMFRQRPTESMGRGKLQIDIVEARLTKNYGFTKMDPYVRLRLGSKIFETPTDYNGGKNPKWKKTIMCYLPFNVDMLLIEIFDEKSFTNDELVAFVKYPLPESLFDGIFLDEWIPLSGKSGELKEGHINVQMLFTPITMNRNSQPNNPNQMTLPRPNVNSNNNSSSSASSASSSSSTTPPLSHTNVANTQNRVQLPPELENLPLYTQDDLNSIKEMFPSFEVEVIKSILESNGGNKEASIEALLQISSEN